MYEAYVCDDKFKHANENNCFHFVYTHKKCFVNSVGRYFHGRENE